MKILITAFFTFLFLSSFYSATILVTNTNDSGAGSLRDAVTNASSGDLVKIDPALIASGSDTIHVFSTIDITTGLTIEGTFSNTDTLYISGGDSIQMFHFYTPSAGAIYNVTLDSLVLVRGLGVYGGAIHVDYDYSVSSGVSAAPGIMTFQNCTFMNNSADHGGAVGTWRQVSVSNRTASVNYRIYGCTFKDNTANFSGGAISMRLSSSSVSQGSFADVDIDSSTFIGNTASGADGGAIYCYAYHNAAWNVNPNKGAGIDLHISRSTISENSSGSEGGGIYCYARDGSSDEDAYNNIFVEYSTISDNSTVSDGGGIFAYAYDLTEIEIRFSTLVFNTAFNEGSGFYNECNFGKADFDLLSSIFALNSDGVGTNNNIYNDGPGNNAVSRFSDGSNIFDNASISIYNPNGDPDHFGISELSLNLEPLTLNNNNTYTRAPGANSFAIDLGPTAYPEEAQNVAIVGNRDIGAAESTVCTFVTVGLSETICAGSSYDFNGQVITTAGSYADTITDLVECDTIFNLTLTVNPLVAPVATISANPGSTIMTGTSVTFTASVTNGGASPNYQWKLNGMNVGFNTSTYTNGTLVDGDVVICDITSNAQCLSIAADESNPITMIVHANNDEPCSAIPVTVGTICTFSYFTNDQASSTIGVADHSCSNDSGHDVWFQFVAPPSGITQVETLSGTLTDAVTSVYEGTCSSLFEIGCIDDVGADKMPYGAFSGGVSGETYYLRVSGWSTLSGSFALCLFEGSGVGVSETKQNEFTIYPNPSQGIVNFQFKESGKRVIKIINTAGQIVMNEIQTGLSGTIDCSNLASGIYQILSIEEDGMEQRQQLIISN